MMTDDIQHVRCRTARQGIGAHGYNPQFPKDLVELSLVVGETVPILLFQPEYVGREAHARVSPRQALLQFDDPVLTHSQRIETAAGEVPVQM
jgi:hypothetical protein